MLLFSFCLYDAAVAIFGHNLPDRLRTNVLGVQGTMGFGFLASVVLTSNPFARLLEAPDNGKPQYNPARPRTGDPSAVPEFRLSDTAMSVV
jgi:cytochrome c biogenesis factor